MDCYNEFEKRFVHGSAFNSAYQFDFKRYCNIKTDEKKKIYHEIKEIKPVPQKYTDRETLSLYNDTPYVPFNLYHYPRPIIQKREVPCVSKSLGQKNYDIIKSRPKMYRSPAVPIDNIEDHEKRDTVIKFMYTSESQMASQWAAMQNEGKKTSEVENINDTVHVSLITDLYEPLDEKCVKKSFPWDDSQNRYMVDPTATFWQKRVTKNNSDNPLENILPEETKQDISELITKDKLRGEHDLRCPTYDGYIPNCTDPIPLAKTDFPISYPFLSVNQTLDMRKNDKEGHKLKYVCEE